MILASRCGWGALLLVAALAAGCGKHEPAPGAGSATNAAALDPSALSSEAPPSPRGPGPMPASPTTTVISDAGNIEATLGQLTSELRKYVLHTRSVPKNFEEFIAKSGVQAPAPPPGKKYAIQNRAVILVKR
jgi:hypothetical protein